MTPEIILLIIILLAGFYMAWNIGANDVANAIGTSVGSGALSMRQAVIIAGIMELCGAFFFGSHVSRTIEEGIVRTTLFEPDPMIVVYGMLSCLIGAGLWLQTASYFGWPVSTTHSIVGSVIGFGLAAGGWQAIYWDQVFSIATTWIISPILGAVLAYLIFQFTMHRIFFSKHPLKAGKTFIPILVFVFFSMITFILIYKGLHIVDISFPIAFFASLSTGLFFSLIFYLYVRSLSNESNATTPSRSQSKMIHSLNKAKLSLWKAKAYASKDHLTDFDPAIAEIETYSDVLQNQRVKESGNWETNAIEKAFSKLQIVSACLMAFSHGANDVANAIGPLIAAVTVLFSGTIIIDNSVPNWALLLGGLGIVVGLSTWGFRVIETIGKKLTELTPSRGFSAEFGAAATILLATRLGFPVSATHTLVGAVLGVGLARGIEALNMRAMRDIAISWVVTIPAGALITVAIFHFCLWIQEVSIGS